VKLLLKETGVALSPGIGFGPMGEGFVRFSLIEDIARTKEAARRIGDFLRNDRILSSLPAEAINV
jgi:aspartate/methionine/tyrosine aminotransferase